MSSLVRIEDIPNSPFSWFQSGAALKGRHECALSQVGPHPDMTLDVTGK